MGILSRDCADQDMKKAASQKPNRHVPIGKKRCLCRYVLRPVMLSAALM
jgi:hypothetical protein